MGPWDDAWISGVKYYARGVMYGYVEWGMGQLGGVSASGAVYMMYHYGQMGWSLSQWGDLWASGVLHGPIG